MFFATSAMPCWGKNKKMMPTAFQKQLSNQHPNLHRFGNQIGSIWGGVGLKLAPNRSKSRSPEWSKKRSPFRWPLDRFFIDFRLQIGSEVGGGQKSLFEFFGPLGPILGPRWPQDLPKTSPRPPQDVPKTSQRPPKDLPKTPQRRPETRLDQIFRFLEKV